MINSLFLKRFIHNNFNGKDKLNLNDVKQKLLMFFEEDELKINDADLINYLNEIGFEEIDIQQTQKNVVGIENMIDKENEDLEDDTLEELNLDAFFDDYDGTQHLKEVGDFRDNKQMLKLYHENSEKDSMLFNKILVNNQPLVDTIAKKYLFKSKGMTLEDLINEGNFGLMRAIERFETIREVSFSTYAHIWIRQSITRAIADKSNMVRIPVYLTDQINKMNRIERDLEAINNKVHVEEVCSLMEIDEEKYYKLKEIQHCFLHEVSLNGKITVENANDEIIDFIPAMNSDYIEVPSVEDIVLLHEKLKVIESELNQLPERERKILVLRFGLEDGEPKTLEEVGRVIGVTRERIRQIEAKAINKLRNSSKLKSIKTN